ncbi:MAG: transcription elongation factor GreA [Caldilineaceae bacterium]|nr:transcription elongation factor GreA [Caldilineaceae bacterium]
MSNNTVYLTKEGYEKLESELDYLINVRRKEVADQIAEAKAEGDISENAGYDEAKNAQAFLEGRIREVENRIRNAQLIDEMADMPANVVALGRTVVVKEVGTDLEETYAIVGSVEVDPKNGRISNESPMGKALLGKKIGEKVTVKTPSGEIQFQILKLE